MKKTFIILFSILFIFTLCACSSENEMSELEKQYYDYAQECIEKGDTQTVIECLEEGITNTGSEELKKLLEEVKGSSTVSSSKDDSSQVAASTENSSNDKTSQKVTSTENVEKQTFDINKYIGWWQESEDIYETGGLYLDIYDDGGSYLQILIENSKTNGDRIASTDYIPVLKKNIKSNKLEFPFEDSFGSTGYASIEFLENKVICTISDLQEPEDGADWAIYNGDYVLKYHGTEH